MKTPISNTPQEVATPGTTAPLPKRSSDSSRPDRDRRAFLLRSFVIPALAYPAWHFAAPRNAIDPFSVWLTIAFVFLAVPVVHWVRPISRSGLQNLVSVCWTIVTLHLFVLAYLNEIAPFFFAGAAIAAFATVQSLRSTRMLVVYGLFVGALATVLLALQPDGRKSAYWGGTVPVLFVAYLSLAAQLARHRDLEAQVAERTLQLSNANQQLRDETAGRSRLEEELRFSHKMEAVGRLAGGIAHDLGNLVTTIGVYSEILLSRLPAESPLGKEVHRIQNATQQAAKLTQRLLTLGRRTHVELERLDLNAVIRDAEPTLRHLILSHVTLELALAPEPQWVTGNADQLEQVLVNLIINAGDAMAKPGHLTIETSRCGRGQVESYRRADRSKGSANEWAEGALPDLDSDRYVRVVVEDQGTGMATEVREHAFDPFFTTKARGRGTGLGLYIVRGIVSHANGYVRVESEPGVGTRCELYWPLAEDAAERAAPSEQCASGGLGRRSSGRERTQPEGGSDSDAHTGGLPGSGRRRLRKGPRDAGGL